MWYRRMDILVWRSRFITEVRNLSFRRVTLHRQKAGSRRLCSVAHTPGNTEIYSYKSYIYRSTDCDCGGMP